MLTAEHYHLMPSGRQALSLKAPPTAEQLWWGFQRPSLIFPSAPSCGTHLSIEMVSLYPPLSASVSATNTQEKILSPPVPCPCFFLCLEPFLYLQIPTQFESASFKFLFKYLHLHETFFDHQLKISPPCILLLCLQHLLTHYTVFLNYFAILPFCPQGLPNINTTTSALWMKACLCLCLCFDQQLGQDRCSVIICGSNWQGHRLSMVEELGLSLNIYLT